MNDNYAWLCKLWDCSVPFNDTILSKFMPMLARTKWNNCIYTFYILDDRFARTNLEKPCASPAAVKSLSTMLLATAQKRKLVETEPHDVEGIVTREVNMYLSATEGVPLDSDPLNWWSSHCNSFPTLAKLAKKYLCINASSVSSERLFSISGNIVSRKRSLLKPETVNKLVFLSCNL